MSNKYQTLVVFFRGKGDWAKVKDDYCRNARYMINDKKVDLLVNGVPAPNKATCDFNHVTWRMGQLNRIFALGVKPSDSTKVNPTRVDLEAAFTANTDMFGWVSENPKPATVTAEFLMKPPKDSKKFKNLEELKGILGYTGKRASKATTTVFTTEDGKDIGSEFLKSMSA